MPTKTTKPTNAQLQKRIANAIVHIDKTKETKSIFFSDKDLRLSVNEDAAVLSIGFMTHIYYRFIGANESRPYLYVSRFVDIALNEKDNIVVNGGYSYSKFLEVLSKKEEQDEFNICKFVDIWMFNITTPVYSIGESKAETFLVVENYWHNIARTSVLLSEKTEDMTNRQFFDAVRAKAAEFAEGMKDEVIFYKKTDEEIAKEAAEAMEAIENEQTLNDQLNASKD